jgi:flagellar basal body-associated protein FliL
MPSFPKGKNQKQNKITIIIIIIIMLYLLKAAGQCFSVFFVNFLPCVSSKHPKKELGGNGEPA